jgi:POT family proton-dependent oligopeptide transporter
MARNTRSVCITHATMSNTANTVLDFQSAPVSARGNPTSELARDHYDDKKGDVDDISVPVVSAVGEGRDEMDTELIPSEEDLLTLRKVAAPLP